MLNVLIETVTTYAYTPDGAIADPNHPIYALLWVLKQVAMWPLTSDVRTCAPTSNPATFIAPSLISWTRSYAYLNQ